MKKIHRKIIHSQARYLDKIVKDIRYLKKGCKLKGGRWWCYSRQERSDIMKKNGNHYKPHAVSSKLSGKNDNSKATIMRELYRKESISLDSKLLFRQKIDRVNRIYGNFYEVKAIICDELFKPIVHVVIYDYECSDGEIHLHQFYKKAKDGLWYWDEDKLTTDEANKKYSKDVYKWVVIEDTRDKTSL